VLTQSPVVKHRGQGGLRRQGCVRAWLCLRVEYSNGCILIECAVGHDHNSLSASHRRGPRTQESQPPRQVQGCSSRCPSSPSPACSPQGSPAPRLSCSGPLRRRQPRRCEKSFAPAHHVEVPRQARVHRFGASSKSPAARHCRISCQCQQGFVGASACRLITAHTHGNSYPQGMRGRRDRVYSSGAAN
jgi:hypothetical protein